MGSKRKFDDSFFNLDSHLLSFLTKLVQSPTGNKIEVIENVGVTKVRAEVEKMERKKREREFFFRRSIAASLFFFAHLPPFFRPLQPLYLDLSDNGVLTLDGFPRLPRLGTLLLSNNRVSRIGANLESVIPNLSTLILTNNALRNLADLDALATLPKLTHLSCMDNVVAKKPLYR
jgi:Leucine-rich repeat (LRR) protein